MATWTRKRGTSSTYGLDAGAEGFFSSKDGIQGPSGWGFDMDYVFIRLKGAPAGNDPSVRYPPNPHYGTLDLGRTVHVPQHRKKGVMKLPEVHPKSDSNPGKLVDVDCCHIYHRASTDPGASGSPILDDAWRLIGIHTHGYLAKSPDPRRRNHNWGTRIGSILDDARQRGFDVSQVPYLLAKRSVVAPGNWI